MYILQKVTITLFQILFVAVAYAKTNAISRACEAAYRNALAILAVATLRSTLCEFSIMFIDTLYSKKWYDMPHIGYGIHSPQRSTISRIGGYSAGYNIGSAQRFRYALFAFIHTQTYFEYYTLTLRLASLVKKAVIYAYWTKELFDICRENVSYMATLPSVARHVIYADNLRPRH